MSAEDGYLVRGIDTIPEGWEVASAHRAIRSLARAETVLTRLIDEAAAHRRAALVRDLRSVFTAVSRGRSHISGGFVIREIESEAGKWKDAERVLLEGRSS